MTITLEYRKGRGYLAYGSPADFQYLLELGVEIQHVTKYGKKAIRSLKDSTVANNLKKLPRIKI
jgi:hypothetical protein